jgi:hypothetical protein
LSTYVLRFAAADASAPTARVPVSAVDPPPLAVPVPATANRL